MKAPCEFISGVVLPSIRAWIAREAMKKGLKQKDIAKNLGLTSAAISQYLKEKRANIEVSERGLEEIRPVINDIVEGMVSGKLTDFDLMKLVCKSCISLRASLILCNLHMKAESTLKKVDCTFCKELFENYKEVGLKLIKKKMGSS